MKKMNSFLVMLVVFFTTISTTNLMSQKNENNDSLITENWNKTYKSYLYSIQKCFNSIDTNLSVKTNRKIEIDLRPKSASASWYRPGRKGGRFVKKTLNMENVEDVEAYSVFREILKAMECPLIRTKEKI